MAKPLAIYWLRTDLRLTDNQALCAAAKDFRVLFLYLHAPDDEGTWRSGAASRWWLHYSLQSLDEALAEKYGTRMLLKAGSACKVISDLVEQTGAVALFYNRRYEPWARAQQDDVDECMANAGVAVQRFDSAALFPPDKIVTQDGRPYKVFTPYWQNVSRRAGAIGSPLKPPTKLESVERIPGGLRLEELRLLPAIDWARGLRAAWQPGESGARRQLDSFIRSGLEQYVDGRNRPDKELVSRLSPHLHFGEISPREVWHAVEALEDERATMKSENTSGCQAFLRELGWRDFAIHLLYNFPDTTDNPLRTEFARFPWSDDLRLLEAWQSGRTGYPIVDAGMRQLWTTGWMHNRVRMIVASFLVKDLRIAWQEGARWFWDTLVDADLANNSLGWQWSAGCGADAAPYFRIFNPVLQGERFDPHGEYVRHWVPELSKLPPRWIHCPWKAPPIVLLDAGVELGTTYPHPVVDHSLARRDALEALESISKKTSVSRYA